MIQLIGEWGFIAVLWIGWLGVVALLAGNLVKALLSGPLYRDDDDRAMYLCFLLMVLGFGFLIIWGWPSIVHSFEYPK